MSKTYYIFRHGETFATKRNTGYGFKVYTAGILEEGRSVIEKLGEYLKDKQIDFAVSSPVLRCRESAEIVGKIIDKEFVIDKRIREFFLETFWHLKRRVVSFVKEIEASEQENILICTHGAIMAALRDILIEGGFHARHLNLYPKPGILLVIKENQIQQIDFNSLSPESVDEQL